MFYNDSYENEYNSDNDSYNIDEEFEETYLDEPYEDDFMADTDLQFEDNADDDTSIYAVDSEETVMTDEPDMDEPDEIEECTEHIDTTTYTEYEETEEEQHNDNFNSIETESEKIEEPIEAEENTESEIEEHEEHEEHEEEKTVDLLKDAVVEQQSQEIEQQSQEIYSRDIEEDEHSSDNEDVDMTSNVDLHGFKDEEFEFKLDKHEEEIDNDFEEHEEHTEETEHIEEHKIDSKIEEDDNDDEIIDFGDIDIEEINKSRENNNNIEEHEEQEEQEEPEEIHEEIQAEPIEAEVSTDDKVEAISEYIEETDEEYEDDIKEIDNNIETFEEHEHISRENHDEILITEKDRDENLDIEENNIVEENSENKQDNESQGLDATIQYEDERVSDDKIGHVSDEIEQQSDTTDEHNVSQYLDSREDIELRAAGVSNLRLQEILIEKIGYMPYEVIKLSRVQMLDIINKEEKKRGNKK